MKKVLIIAYYLNDENMGAIRLRRVIKYLSHFGVEPTVLTAMPEEVVINEVLGARIERVAALDLKSVYERILSGGNKPTSGQTGKKMIPRSKKIGFTAFLNRWLMVPDKQIPWMRPAINRGRELIDKGEYDLIFASLEPRTNLLVASTLAKYSGLPCVMEYRDLWNNNPYHFQQQPTPLHKWVHRYLERKVLSSATRISTVCLGIQSDLKQLGNNPALQSIDLNYNFFDPDEYEITATARREPRPFTIIYAGAMYASRNPYAFFRGLRIFIDAHRLEPKDIRFKWIGVVAALPGLDQTLVELDLYDFIDFSGPACHADALVALQLADASLILQSPEDTIHIPGKLFEAFGARIPVLTLANPCEVTDIIDRVKGGVHVPYQPEKVADALETLWKGSAEKQDWTFDEAEVQRFSAVKAIEKLVNLFKQAMR